MNTKDNNRDFDIARTIQQIIDNKEIAQSDNIALKSAYENDSQFKEMLCELSDEEALKGKLSTYGKNINVGGVDKFNALLKEVKATRKRRQIFTSLIKTTAIAAAVVVLYVGVFNRDNQEEVVANEVITTTKTFEIAKPILYSGNDTITMSDKRGSIDVKFNNLKAEEAKKEPVVNKLVIPYGYTYTVLLADGTVVTLNSNSELSYPTEFNDEQREVSFKGEAFFDVAKSDKQFVVKSNSGEIKVYGTTFNANAREEGVLKTVLVSGSVGVKGSAMDSKQVMLTPNQLAVSGKSGTEIKEVNTSDYIGWIDNKFRFVKKDLSSVLNELSEWYGVEFLYNKDSLAGIDITLTANRNEPLDKTLNIIKNISETQIYKKGGQYRVEK